jgi:glycosyltransferase involved in cell wall biosynthesis
MTETFAGRLGIQQRVLPFYRPPFFSALAEKCAGGLELFAGLPRQDEAIEVAGKLEGGRWINAQNIHLLRSSLYMCIQPGFQSWLQGFQPDVLIVEANPRYPSTPNAIRWMHSRNRPVIGWGLGAPPMKGKLTGLQAGSRNRFLSSLDAVIAYSLQGAKEYASCGISPDNIFIAPNSAAFRPVKPPGNKPDRWDVRPQVLFVGRIQSRKRLDLLFQACAQLPQDLQPMVTIVGDGPDRSLVEKTAAISYQHVAFTGTKTGEELDTIFQSADLFVLPGTGGLAVQQAMSFGLPVIVAEGDGTQSQLVRPSNGWIVTPGSLEELARALKDALSDPQNLRAKGMDSYRIVRDEVNIEKMVEVFIHAANTVRLK